MMWRDSKGQSCSGALQLCQPKSYSLWMNWGRLVQPWSWGFFEVRVVDRYGGVGYLFLGDEHVYLMVVEV